MDKETLSNYGWIVICVLVLAVMLSLASPFGKFVSGAVQSTTQGLFDVNQEALGAAGIEIMGQEFENELNGGSDGDQGDTETPVEPETPTELTFTIDGTEYQYDEGMTWETWCASSYNTAPNSFYIRPDDEYSDGDRVVSDNITSGDFKYIMSSSFSGGSITMDAVLPTDNIASQTYITGTVTLPTATPTLITFYWQSTELQAEKGMTWGEWCESKYNTCNLKVISDRITQSDPNEEWMFDQDYGKSAIISPSDVIIEGKLYVMWID